eukprot:Pompholyxophrys_sp_v1_NODE_269_length_924_cov_2.120829.p1 type:complete len:125 gc:universal NODE_269_length_924_cov_2.120829:759-385(-)
MAEIREVVERNQAPDPVKFHAVYSVQFLGLSQKEVSFVYCKSEATISRWVNRYRETGSVGRVSSTKRFLKLTEEHRKWVVNYVHKNPLSYLSEIRKDFQQNFHLDISSSSIFRILDDNNTSNAS